MSKSPSNEVCFSVEGRLFSFKTYELCEASEYFRAMLSGNFSESNKYIIGLEDINVKLFSIFHKWLTTPDEDLAISDLHTEELIQLIYLMARFFAPKLMHLCNLEALERLQNENGFAHESRELRNQRIELFVQFFKAAETIANTELKDMFVKWLMQESSGTNDTDSHESLLNKKRQIENFTEVDQIRDICEILGEKESFELKKMISEQAKDILDNLDKQIERKKKADIVHLLDEYQRINEEHSRSFNLKLHEILEKLNNRGG